MQIKPNEVFDANRKHFLSLGSKHLQVNFKGMNEEQLQQIIVDDKKTIEDQTKEIEKLKKQLEYWQHLSQNTHQIATENQSLKQEIQNIKEEYIPIDYKVPQIASDQMQSKEKRMDVLEQENVKLQKMYEKYKKLEENCINVKNKLQILDKTYTKAQYLNSQTSYYYSEDRRENEFQLNEMNESNIVG